VVLGAVVLVQDKVDLAQVEQEILQQQLLVKVTMVGLV
jgi:hypothetical protein